MKFIFSALEKFVWWIWDKVLRFPWALSVFFCGALFLYLAFSHPYIFRRPNYNPSPKTLLDVEDLGTDIQYLTLKVKYPDHLKADATPHPLYVTGQISSTVPQTVVVTFESLDTLVILPQPRQELKMINDHPLNSEVSIGYLPCPFSWHQKKFALTSKIEIQNAKYQGEPILIGVDSESDKIAALLAGLGTLISLMLSMKSFITNT